VTLTFDLGTGAERRPWHGQPSASFDLPAAFRCGVIGKYASEIRLPSQPPPIGWYQSSAIYCLMTEAHVCKELAQRKGISRIFTARRYV